MDAIDRQLINLLQEGLPICPAPFRDLATQLALSEAEVIERLKVLLADGTLTRFGPMYHAEQMGGALTLAALKVPPERFDAVTEIVNAFPEVAHNYERSHELNMWFVLATETPEQVALVIAAIEAQTGLKVYNMPKQREYFVNLKLDA